MLGWFVFALPKPDQDARGAARTATNEPADIYDLWGMDLEADHDVGVASGPSRLLVIECSAEGGLDGFVSRQGLSPALPTVVVCFGSRQHLYFSTRDLDVEVGASIFNVGNDAAAESRADHVVGAGSWRDGLRYEYAFGHAPDETKIAALAPDWARYLKATLPNRISHHP